MIELLNFSRAFESENNFYLSCNPTKIGKFIAHLYKKYLHFSFNFLKTYG